MDDENQEKYEPTTQTETDRGGGGGTKTRIGAALDGDGIDGVLLLTRLSHARPIRQKMETHYWKISLLCWSSSRKAAREHARKQISQLKQIEAIYERIQKTLNSYLMHKRMAPALQELAKLSDGKLDQTQHAQHHQKLMGEQLSIYQDLMKEAKVLADEFRL